ncbi:MAG: hypothetical protein WCX74_02400 [Candidatus Paceibacterota bacterium]
MKKVGIIAVLAIIIVLVIGCFAVYSYYETQKKEKLFASRVEDFRSRKAYFEDFTKRFEGDEVWMDSDKAKVSVKIPREWDAFEGSFSAISMKSKDFLPMDGDVKKAPLPSTGCWIDFNVQIDKMENGYKNFIMETLNNDDYFSTEDSDEKKVKVGKYEALLNMSPDERGEGKAVFMKVPVNNFTYKIDSYFFGKDKERCEKEFDDFLNSLVIK